MASRKKGQSLAEKISSLVTAAPSHFDSDDENDDTAAKLVDTDLEDNDSNEPDIAGYSSFRTRNINLLDEEDKKYAGKKVSRKTIEKNQWPSESEESDGSQQDDSDNSDDENPEDHENDDDARSAEDEESDAEDEDQSADNSDDEEEEESDDEPELEIDEANPLRRRDAKAVNFQHVRPTDVQGEIEKGQCVRSQLIMWENLLEMRIKLQKCLLTANKMPQHDTYQEFRTDESFCKSAKESQKNLSHLLNNLLELRNNLLKNYPETKNLNSPRVAGKKSSENGDADEEIPSDTDEEITSDTNEELKNDNNQDEEEEVATVARKRRKLHEYEPILSKDHKVYGDYRNSVIQKWNDKTRIAVGNTNKGPTQPLVRQIEFVLSDKVKLRKRTQLQRSEYEILGKRGVDRQDEDGRRVQEYDTEIYDDDDFYHQLLRELIEFKSADVTDPIQLSKQWIHLQNMRSKMKRKIDTKATKGRRIRYGVHTKLVNFMAPMSLDDNWNDETKTELYNSLFGKAGKAVQK